MCLYGNSCIFWRVTPLCCFCQHYHRWLTDCLLQPHGIRHVTAFDSGTHLQWNNWYWELTSRNPLFLTSPWSTWLDRMVECHIMEVSVFFILICILYLSVVDLQCCASFRCTAESLLSVLIDPFFFRVFSRVGYFRMLSRDPPCPLQWIVKVTQSCPTLREPMDCSPWSSPGQNTWVGSLSLLQGIFPTQGSNPGLLHCSRLFTC